MNTTVKAITITPEQIIGAAQLITNKMDDSWEFTEGQILQAVRNYLYCKMTDIISEADWHANKDNFAIGSAKEHTPSVMDEATELVMPEPPEWAHDEIAKKKNKVFNRHTAPLAPRPERHTEEDGDQIYA